MLVYLLIMLLILPIGLPLGALIKLWQLKPHLNKLGEVEKLRKLAKKQEMNLKKRHTHRASIKRAKVSDGFPQPTSQRLPNIVQEHLMCLLLVLRRSVVQPLSPATSSPTVYNPPCNKPTCTCTRQPPSTVNATRR